MRTFEGVLSMKRPYHLQAIAVLSLSLVMLASCTNEQKPAPTAQATRSQTTVTTQPGVAGGVFEDVYIVQAIVSVVDVPSRRVTLTGPQGNEYSFKAGPEIRNLAQVQTGDKVTATFARRMVIIVRDDNATPSLASD